MILIEWYLIRYTFEINKYLNEIINIINKTGLHTAVENENIEIIKLLLSNDKIDVNSHSILNFIFSNKIILIIVNVTALHKAIELENEEIVKLLLNNNRIDVNAFSIFFNLIFLFNFKI